jgi:hypothetical protein
MKGNNLILGVLAIIVLSISGVLIARGIADYSKNKDKGKTAVVSDIKQKEEEIELTEYYDVGFESDDPDSYARNDPFREVCSQVDLEEGTTVVYSNVVCFK